VLSATNGLINQINALGLPNGTTTSLVAKLNDLITAFNTGDVATACADMTALSNEVNAQSGKKLTITEANDLLAVGAEIQVLLACP